MGLNRLFSRGLFATLSSFRGRYTLVMALLTAAIVAVAWLSYRHGEQVATETARLAGTQARSVVLLNDSFSELHRYRQDLHDFLLLPDGKLLQRLIDTQQRLASTQRRLAAHTATHASLDIRMIVDRLGQDTGELQSAVGTLIGVRLDPSAWFPATQLIEERLQANNDLFIAQLDALLDAVLNDADDTDIALVATLYEIQKAWLRSVDELRLVIANRFGAHALDPSDGMRARTHNVEAYLDRVLKLLRAIAESHADDDDTALLIAQIELLGRHAEAWQSAYRELLPQLGANTWRRDLALLREQIDPHLQHMLQRLQILRVELQSQVQQQIGRMNEVSQRMGWILAATLAVMLLFGIAGYVSLNRLILRPLRELSHSLKDRSRLPHNLSMDAYSVDETRDLVYAFNEMQVQVKAREQALDHLAHHDLLTGLPNRGLFRRRLGEAITDADRYDRLVGVLFMDIDRFKQVNDSYGHAAGDELLVQFGERLKAIFRTEDTIARLGGDEFSVLLEKLHNRDEMTNLAEKAIAAIQEPFDIQGRRFYSAASIGIAVAPDDGVDPDRLIQLADAAMYAAKQESGSSYRYVDSSLNTRAAARHMLENEVRRAVESHELRLHFQPVTAVRDGSVHCYESLLRWPHSDHGMLHPASFMNALADIGLCGTISDWVLDELQGNRPSPEAVVSLNLSARLLHDDRFAARLLRRLESGALPPEQLIIEITEDTLEADLAAASRVLHKLRQLGVRIALDDFGTGQASLSHLRQFPFDYIKIDQSFVARIGRFDADEKLVRALIHLVHTLGMKAVAEGVESESQRQFLAEADCDYLQGYLIGKPAAGERPAPKPPLNDSHRA
jgi:diguanylate cyclase (GGDEF)-like protein